MWFRKQASDARKQKPVIKLFSVTLSRDLKVVVRMYLEAETHNKAVGQVLKDVQTKYPKAFVGNHGDIIQLEPFEYQFLITVIEYNVINDKVKKILKTQNPPWNIDEVEFY